MALWQQLNRSVKQILKEARQCLQNDLLKCYQLLHLPNVTIMCNTESVTFKVEPNWNDSVSPEFRDEVIRKMSLFLPENITKQERWIQAIALEVELFVQSNSCEEYYHSLAHELDRLMKERKGHNILPPKLNLPEFAPKPNTPPNECRFCFPLKQFKERDLFVLEKSCEEFTGDYLSEGYYWGEEDWIMEDSPEDKLEPVRTQLQEELAKLEELRFKLKVESIADKEIMAKTKSDRLRDTYKSLNFEFIDSSTFQPQANWRDQISAEQNKEIVNKMVEAFFPDSSSWPEDHRLLTVMQTYCNKIQTDMFKCASSREEYHRLLVNNVFGVHEYLSDNQQKQESTVTEQANNSAAESSLSYATKLLKIVDSCSTSHNSRMEELNKECRLIQALLDITIRVAKSDASHRV